MTFKWVLAYALIFLPKFQEFLCLILLKTVDFGQFRGGDVKKIISVLGSSNQVCCRRGRISGRCRGVGYFPGVGGPILIHQRAHTYALAYFKRYPSSLTVGEGRISLDKGKMGLVRRTTQKREKKVYPIYLIIMRNRVIATSWCQRSVR